MVNSVCVAIGTLTILVLFWRLVRDGQAVPEKPRALRHAKTRSSEKVRPLLSIALMSALPLDKILNL